MNRRSSASIVASPVLVGAVSVLVTIIAVFIAYNANSGLPFVPTYDLKAELPSGGKLVKGNEVRIGGFRVGVVSSIAPKPSPDGRRSIAVIEMKLDKSIAPLSRDTKLTVRQRSALGLKYVELKPGRSSATYSPGDTISLRNSGQQLELEDVFSTLNPRTRTAVRAATEGFGDAFAGRGESLNGAIEALNPLFRHLRPVMAGLADPPTQLDRLFVQLERVAGQVAPVAGVQAELFGNTADTFAAIARDPGALQATIEKSPSTLEVATRSLRVQRPFLADLTDVSHRLRPAVAELPRSLPALTSALAAGRPVLARSVPLGRRFEQANTALEELFANPNTLLTLRDLRTALEVTRPAVEYLAPYQLVCNYGVIFFNQLGRHFGAPLAAGTAERVLLKLALNPGQDSQLGTTESSHPADIAADQDPQRAQNAFGKLQVLHGQPRPPAVDAQGNADCQSGQWGYLNRLVANPRANGPSGLGNNHVVVENNTPGLAGPTYDTLRLGIHNLSDVP
ncbi:MAG TPA: MlaD family protein [Thermoleophilaceae bacterium]|jgi:virulence factor Mce-like protein